MIDILQTLDLMPPRNSWEAWNELHLMACRMIREREERERSGEGIPGTTIEGDGK